VQRHRLLEQGARRLTVPGVHAQHPEVPVAVDDLGLSEACYACGQELVLKMRQRAG